MANTSLAEKVLGRRTVNYLKNEALVGRISKHKLQVFDGWLLHEVPPSNYLNNPL